MHNWSFVNDRADHPSEEEDYTFTSLTREIATAFPEPIEAVCRGKRNAPLLTRASVSHVQELQPFYSSQFIGKIIEIVGGGVQPHDHMNPQKFLDVGVISCDFVQ